MGQHYYTSTFLSDTSNTRIHLTGCCGFNLLFYSFDLAVSILPFALLDGIHCAHQLGPFPLAIVAYATFIVTRPSPYRHGVHPYF